MHMSPHRYSSRKQAKKSLFWSLGIAATLSLVLMLGFFGCSGNNTPLQSSSQTGDNQQIKDNVIPGQYIVVLKSTKQIGRGVAAKVSPQYVASIAEGVGAKAERVYTTVLHGFSAKLTDDEYKALLNNPAVDYIEPDRPVHMIAQTVPWGITAVKAQAAHARGVKGAGVKVGVIDTGIDHAHPDLAANYAGGIDYVNGDNDPMDDNGHGTHVSGTIAAIDNTIGVLGVAPAAKLYGIKVLDANGSGTFSNVIAGIDWAAANGMNVVNMSLGASVGTSGLQTACDNAYAAGVVICAAAGNDYGGPVSYPAKYSSTIAVSAVDQNNNLAFFSNKGPEVEVTAPGVGIYSTYFGGRYATLDGTSMATPHAAGVCALIWSTGQFNTAAAVRNQLTSTATDLGPAGRDNNFGYGLVNADAATAGAPPANQPPVANANGPYSGTVGNPVSFSSAGSNDPDGSITAYSWDFGDGATSTAANPTHTYSAAGTYTVTLTVTDNQG
ncbi:MAG: PKD domain-containing protein, partial [Candidatus Zixiibacteriota bacterium]